MTKILIKRLSKEVPLPKYETNGSSGMDLAANINDSVDIKPGKTGKIHKKGVYTYGGGGV